MERYSFVCSFCKDTLLGLLMKRDFHPIVSRLRGIRSTEGLLPFWLDVAVQYGCLMLTLLDDCR